MDGITKDELAGFLDLLGLDEEPMGIFYTDTEPKEGFAPETMDLPTREKEMQNKIDWQAVFAGFSCVMGHIWRARKKKTAAYFDARHFGCPGGAFFLGFMKPQTEPLSTIFQPASPAAWRGNSIAIPRIRSGRFFITSIRDPRPGSFA